MSPALDLTYGAQTFVLGSTNRVREVHARPGGKAVNVARILHQLGEPAQLLLPLGGSVGADLSRDLEALGVAATIVSDRIATRRTVTLVDDAATTVIVEPAAVDSWPELVAAFGALLRSAEVVVISGTVPSGVPADAMSTLVGLTRAADLPVIVDTGGDALVDALSAGPSIVKPNAEELAGVLQAADPVTAARQLAETYGTTVIASLGHDGLVAATPVRTWVASPAAVLRGNPTGAGDAVVAGLARALRAHAHLTDQLPGTLRDCVALAAAAVVSPTAGDLDLAVYAAQREGAVVRELDGGAG